MVHRSSPTYSALTLMPSVPAHAEQAPSSHKLAAGRTLRESSAKLMLYIDPGAAKALKRYALDADCKVHDLLIEALEEWFQHHGLRGSVRVRKV